MALKDVLVMPISAFRLLCSQLEKIDNDNFKASITAQFIAHRVGSYDDLQKIIAQ